MDSLNLEMTNGLNRHVAAGGGGGGGEWLKEGCIGSLGLADANCYTENG